jgi:hypothetical protein
MWECVDVNGLSVREDFAASHPTSCRLGLGSYPTK